MTTNPPASLDWNEIIEVLHALTNTMTARGHYGEGHPAIVRADEAAGAGLVRLLDRTPEVVVALIDGEFVVSERPFPALRSRLHVLADAMLRHEIECIVFQKGASPADCATLGRALASPAEEQGAVRLAAQSRLTHILLRFVELKKADAHAGVATSAHHFVPAVTDLLTRAAAALSNGDRLDTGAIAGVAREILQTCSLRSFVLTERAWTRTMAELATHATNVAMTVGAMAIESELPESVSADLVAAALLHDVGHLLLPDEVRGLPEPLVEEKHRPLFKNHTFAGASALLAAGAPPLWIAAALEHHRGVDGGGYPALGTRQAPHELVRMIGLANYFDRKRTLLDGGRTQTPEAVLRDATSLEDRYFGRPLVAQFVRALGVYPPGTTVELSNREPALVVGANPHDPWRPRVLVLRGEHANKRIDLREIDGARSCYALSIVRAIPPPLFVLADFGLESAPFVSSTTSVAPPAPRRAAPPPRPEQTSMVDVLDLALGRDRLVTSPPPAPSVPPPPRLSRPVVVQEVVSLGARGYSSPPDRLSSASIPAVRITIPPLSKPTIDAREEPPDELPPETVLRITGKPPTDLDHRGAFILGFIDGMSSLEDILDASGVPKSEVLRIVADLLAKGTLAIDRR